PPSPTLFPSTTLFRSRYATAAEFAAALSPGSPTAPAESAIGALGRLARSPRYAIPAAVLLGAAVVALIVPQRARAARERARTRLDRKSTRLNSSHLVI